MEARNTITHLFVCLCLPILVSCGTEQRSLATNEGVGQEGDPFPPFIAHSLQGGTIDNTYFNEKVTLVSTWRLGCEWSMKEIPEYIRLHASVNDPRFQMISMAPQTKEELEAFYDPATHASMVSIPQRDMIIPTYDVIPMCNMKRVQHPDSLGAQCNALSELLGVDVFPVTFVVGPDGVIRHRHDGLIVDPETMEPDISAFRRDLDSLLHVL